MCIPTKIQRYIQQKAELDIKIAKLEELESATAPVKNMLAELLADYVKEAPEDLAAVWEEILVIGQQHNLSVQPLAVDELQQWEAVNTENENLRKEDRETKRQYLELLEVSANRVKELESELEKEKYNYSTLVVIDKQLNQQLENLQSQMKAQFDEYRATPPLGQKEREELENLRATLQKSRSQLAQIQPDQKPEVWHKEEIVLGLENLYQESLTENAEAVSESIPTLTTLEPDSEMLVWKRADGAEIAIYEEVSAASPEPEYESEEALANLIDRILISHGFFMPDMKVGGQYSEDEKYEDCQGWASYRQSHDRGVTGIGLYHEKFGFWDASTEMIGEDDTTFPDTTPEPTKLQKLLKGNSNFTFEELGVSVAIESVFTEQEVESEGEEARITATNATGKTLEYYVDGGTFVFQYRVDLLEQAALGYAQHFLRDLEKDAKIKEKITQWKADDAQQLIESVEPEPAKPETETEFETMGFKVRVYPQPPMGATFRFLNPDDTTAFSTSLLTAEIVDRTWKVCAWDLIQSYREKEAERIEKEQNPYKKPEDDFVELVKLTPAVGYLKRRDNGELIAAYAAFSNRCANGDKATSFAKVRAKKWAQFLGSSLENCGWKVEEPRNIKRMVAPIGAKQQFSYEIKITGFSLGQLQKLAEEDFSLLPNETAVIVTTPPAPALTRTYQVKVNSYELASGTEEEMRSRFEEELKTLGGQQMSVSLLTGSEVIESYRVADFKFVQVEDFDSDNPEYEATYLPLQKSFRIYKRLADTDSPLNGWTNTVYQYTPGFTKPVAAATDVVRRSLLQEVNL